MGPQGIIGQTSTIDTCASGLVVGSISHFHSGLMLSGLML
ncbi:hypothetical protein PtrV1_08303 [Pyrenophora tritici-repentis]|uniref:Uncharacterized protein n=1 Tax=Pyrenophora tritici-repentis TaxID=45151 RepID=A0A5M9L605_9PLEO|nr:hypothetical protein PtrV1_08303 [Pyrenophora tritici-repentis]KAF7570643.1 hypothetical protein PtrM4_106450 [Pyrenophora tritici-repentis]KAI1514440.1 hypothetical protein Ptr86124_007070 [Pyrenophora tritici-repentis]KAI1666999.1 hypothetical protein L13192_09243 [Pyrenophora tritici-repentis]KAI1682845.1 hypothetical protein KJE20_07577 [Pyrenophora tritici-repentis]